MKLTSDHHLNPVSHTLAVMSPKTGHLMDYDSSQTIGSLGIDTVYVTMRRQSKVIVPPPAPSSAPTPAPVSLPAPADKTLPFEVRVLTKQLLYCKKINVRRNKLCVFETDRHVSLCFIVSLWLLRHTSEHLRTPVYR